MATTTRMIYTSSWSGYNHTSALCYCDKYKFRFLLPEWFGTLKNVMQVCFEKYYYYYIFC